MDKLAPMQMKRLPKWAQSHINSLYSKVEYLQQNSRELFRGDPEDARVILLYMHEAQGKDSDHQPMPKTQRVRFRFPSPRGRMTELYIDVGIDFLRERLQIHGSDVLTVRPQATNVLSVEVSVER